MNAPAHPLTPLAVSHADVLARLKAAPGADHLAIAKATGRDRSNVKRDLPKLAEEGLIDADNRLTAHGEAVLRALDRAAGAEGSTSGAAEGYAELLVGQVSADPLNPRKHFDLDAIAELADSIDRDGLLENLVVRAARDGDVAYLDVERPLHRLVAGERRWRALMKLIADGRWPAERPILCKVLDIDDAGHRRLALVENLQRKDLRPIDEATALKELMAVTGAGTAEVAAEIGFTQRFVQQRLQLLELPAIKQVELNEGKITIEDARRWIAAEAGRANPAPRHAHIFAGCDKANARQRLAMVELADKVARSPLPWDNEPAVSRPRLATRIGQHYPDPSGAATYLVYNCGIGFGGGGPVSGAETCFFSEGVEAWLRAHDLLTYEGDRDGILAQARDAVRVGLAQECRNSRRYATPWLNEDHVIEPKAPSPTAPPLNSSPAVQTTGEGDRAAVEGARRAATLQTFIADKQARLGEGLEAIEFAIKIDDHYDRLEFLKSWLEGSCFEEWPEFDARRPEAEPEDPELTPTLRRLAGGGGAARQIPDAGEDAEADAEAGA